MKTVSLLGVASYLPSNVVATDFFAPGAAGRRGMFTAPTTRRHVARDENAADMIERASNRLVAHLGLDAARDIDIVFTNVTVPDQPFTGCGAEVAHRLGACPRWVIDLHNSGCVSFIYMMELARLIMTATDARGALLCNVQNAAGRVFSHPEVRLKSQAPVPGDGCGVGYLAPSDLSPILSVIHRCHGENANDMSVAADDGRRYWEPGVSPALAFFASPNNPTGNRFDPDVLCRLARLADAVFVVDEAYADFDGATLIPRIRATPGLFVMRSLSKIGLAGLRLGALVGPRDAIAELDKVRLPWNVNVVSVALGCATLRHPERLERRIRATVELRGALERGLRSIPGLVIYPSHTNFVLVKTLVDAGAVFAGLLARGVLVKNVSAPGLLEGCLRITVGSALENERCIRALGAAIDEVGSQTAATAQLR